jgi:hypothetical protein
LVDLRGLMWGSKALYVCDLAVIYAVAPLDSGTDWSAVLSLLSGDTADGLTKPADDALLEVRIAIQIH